jgi:hypothetical protein
MSHGDHQGPIALIDRAKGPFDTAAITNITPDTRPHYQMSRSHHDSFRDPYPISRDHFLVAHNPDNQHNWGLYVIDRYGNRELLYAIRRSAASVPVRCGPSASARPGQFAGRPIGQQGLRASSPCRTSTSAWVRRSRAAGPGTCTSPKRFPPVLEACCPAGSTARIIRRSPISMPRPSIWCAVPRRASKRARPTRRWACCAPITTGGPRDGSGAGAVPCPRRQGWPSYVAKASLGTVPIAEDGSANFVAPAGKVLYFQLLDEHFNELQRMRSVIQLQPGERRSCIGCHEDRHSSPPPEIGSACCSRRGSWSLRRGAPPRSITNRSFNRCWTPTACAATTAASRDAAICAGTLDDGPRARLVPRR